MSDGDLVYVNFHERQFLGAEDFITEQSYHQLMRWRHNVAQHSWGVVYCLEPTFDTASNSFIVHSGMAVDGYGREVILQQQHPFGVDVFDQRASDTLDVLIGYARVGSDRLPPAFGGCQPDNGDTDDAPVPDTRWREQPLVSLRVPDGELAGRRKPPSVPASDWDFTPDRSFRDDPQQDWPIFLGALRRERIDGAWHYSVDLADRPIAGLVGWQISDPAGRGKIEIGTEGGTGRRFAVYLPNIDQVACPGAEKDPRLEIDTSGEIGFRGHTTLQGNLTMAGGAVAFERGDARSNADPSWRMYHCQVTNPPSGTDQFSGDELRIEMPKSTGATPNRIAIGAWDAGAKRFEPCLTITDDCQVIVHGDLTVEQTFFVPDPTPASMDSMAQQYLMSAHTSSAGRYGELPVVPRDAFINIEPLLNVVHALQVEPQATVSAFVEQLNDPKVDGDIQTALTTAFATRLKKEVLFFTLGSTLTEELQVELIQSLMATVDKEVLATALTATLGEDAFTNVLTSVMQQLGIEGPS